MKCELHAHTNYSDGVLSPEELVKLAKEKEIGMLAITDHNSVEGIKEAQKEGEKLGITVIPGAEILSSWCEILGYFIDIENKELLSLLETNKKEIDTTAKRCIKGLNSNGINVTYEEIQSKYPNYPMMFINIAQYLVKKRILMSTLELQTNYIGKKFELSFDLPSTEFVIKTIKKAGGVAVLAHPYIEQNYKLIISKIPELINAGLDGIEIENSQYPCFDKERIAELKGICEKYGLIPTCGTDFHEETHTSSIGTATVTKEVISELEKRKQIKT